MRQKLTGWLSAVVLSISPLIGSPLHAQSAEAAKKPPMYTYVAQWQVPRAKWTDFEKPNAARDKVFSQAVSNGTLVAYGLDQVEVHHADGVTHDSFWSAMSMAGVLDVLDSIGKGPPDPLLQAATKHSDVITVSRYYNWKPGTYKGAYTHGGEYKLKDSAPDDAVDTMSVHFIVPLMEKLLADGSIVEYEVDEEAIHTESPDKMWIIYITPDAAGIDKANKAVGEAFKGNAFAGPGLQSMLEGDAHRDFLTRTNATFK